MQYTVPQDIEVEDKIIGPLSLKQFGYMLGGAGFGKFFYAIISGAGIPGFIGFVFALIPATIGFAFAFVPYNSRPLDYYIMPAITFITSNKTMIWRKIPPTASEVIKRREEAKAAEEVALKTQQESTPIESIPLNAQESRIKHIAAIVDSNINTLEPEPKTMFDVDAARDMGMKKNMQQAAIKVEGKFEPTIESMASISAEKSAESSASLVGDSAFDKFVMQKKSEQDELNTRLGSAQIIKRNAES